MTKLVVTRPKARSHLNLSELGAVALFFACLVWTSKRLALSRAFALGGVLLLLVTRGGGV